MVDTNKIDAFRANSDLYRLDREIMKQEGVLRELRLEMFVKLIAAIDIEHPEKTEKRLLSRLFNICRELADEDDPRAKYWLAMFYGGKLGTSVVGPEYRKAILYINGVGGRLPTYDLAVDVCEYFGKHRNALTYAVQGIVSADILLRDRLKLARYLADKYFVPTFKISLPEGTSKDFVKAFLEFLSKNYYEFGLKPDNMRCCIEGFSSLVE